MSYTSDNIVEIKPVLSDKDTLHGGQDVSISVSGSKVNLNPKLNEELIEVTNGPLDSYFRPNKAKLYLYETYGKPMETYECSIEQSFIESVDFNRLTCAFLSCWQYCNSIEKVFLYVKWTDPNLYIKSVADLVRRIEIQV